MNFSFSMCRTDGLEKFQGSIESRQYVRVVGPTQLAFQLAVGKSDFCVAASGGLLAGAGSWKA